MRTVIYYRDFDIRSFKGELDAALSYFHCVPQRTMVEKGDLVVCRYSALPFYAELEQDLKNNGAEMINSYQQHRYIADMQNWYHDLEELTPKTWFRASDVPMNEPGSFVLKGETNSKKFQWNTHMFAESRSDVGNVMINLMNDGLIGSQNIYVRQYVPLKKYLDGEQGMPITDEYRFFICDGEILTGAFYWSSHIEDIKEECGVTPTVKDVPKDFLKEVIDRVGKSARFWVLDVGRTKSGDWIVIELNDGQMSGLSENCSRTLYKRLAAVLSE